MEKNTKEEKKVIWSVRVGADILGTVVGGGFPGVALV